MDLAQPSPFDQPTSELRRSGMSTVDDELMKDKLSTTLYIEQMLQKMRNRGPADFEARAKSTLLPPSSLGKISTTIPHDDYEPSKRKLFDDSPGMKKLTIK